MARKVVVEKMFNIPMKINHVWFQDVIMLMELKIIKKIKELL